MNRFTSRSVGSIEFGLFFDEWNTKWRESFCSNGSYRLTITFDTRKKKWNERTSNVMYLKQCDYFIVSKLNYLEINFSAILTSYVDKKYCTDKIRFDSSLMLVKKTWKRTERWEGIDMSGEFCSCEISLLILWSFSLDVLSHLYLNID